MKEKEKVSLLLLLLLFAGQTWQEKVGVLRNELKELGLDGIVVTALDEIAWLLNLRGADVPYSPLVKSYAFVSLQQVVLFVEPLKLKVAPIREHLESDRCPREQSDGLCVEYVGTMRHFFFVVRPYLSPPSSSSMPRHL